MSFKDFNENHSNPYEHFTNVSIIFSFANKFQFFVRINYANRFGNGKIIPKVPV